MVDCVIFLVMIYLHFQEDRQHSMSYLNTCLVGWHALESDQTIDKSWNPWHMRWIGCLIHAALSQLLLMMVFKWSWNVLLSWIQTTLQARNMRGQGPVGWIPSESREGETVCSLLASAGLLAIFGVPWLIDTSSASLPLLPHGKHPPCMWFKSCLLSKGI